MVDFDNLRTKAEEKAKGLREKAEDYVDGHRDQIDKGLDRAGDFVGRKTGKNEQAGNAVDKVKGFLDRNEATDGKPGDDVPPPPASV